MEKLNKLLNDLGSKIEYRNEQNSIISKSDIAWHLDHSLKVINVIIETLKNSNPEDYKSSFNFNKTLVYTLGFIPRGKGKAKSVRSYEKISLENIKEQLDQSKKMVVLLEQLQDKNHFKHPYFGNLNLKETIRFLEIHTKHHLKIIDSILLHKKKL